MRVWNLGMGLLAASCLLASCGRPTPSKTKSAWNRENDPANLRDHYKVVFADLPLSGELDPKPWTDTYWPDYKGGLAIRWTVDRKGTQSWSYPLADRDTVMHMSADDLKALSPAEKYDILSGNYDYPTVRTERMRTSPDAPTWWGLCHGWSAAAINFQEPKPTVIKNAEGVAIPFGSSDIKALLTFAQQDHRSPWDGLITGERCYDEVDNHERPTPDCPGLNPGSLHIALINEIALLKEPFVANVNHDDEIWNQPVHGFSTKVIARSDEVYPDAATGTKSIVTVETEFRYISEVGPRWNQIPWEKGGQSDGIKKYQYNLELNAAGEIIGGAWLGDERPSFFWLQKPAKLVDQYGPLGKLYTASTGEAAP